jgi:diguanylate cyclase (GGDEF)-like protein/PAS domain S-box-containing protein
VNILQNTAYLSQLFEGVYLVDKDRKILYWNQAAERITGYSAKEVVNKSCYDNLLMHVDASGKELCLAGCPLQASVEDGQIHNAAVFLRHKQGYRVPVNVRSVPLKDDHGLIDCVMEVFTRTEQSASDEQMKLLARKAFLDSLTGLPNKEYLENKLKNMLASKVPGDISQWGILFVDIDNLREIAKDQGLAAADATVKVAAKTILENLQTGELAARWDAGLFLLVTGLDKKAILLNWANKIKSLLEHSRVPDYEPVSLKICIGGLIANVGDSFAPTLQKLESSLQASRSANGSLDICDS